MMRGVKKTVATLVWFAVAALGAWAYLTLALRRREEINSIHILLAALCSYAIGFRFYSKWIAARVLALDDRRATPCEVHDDGRDFVKTNKWIVFGHHFAAISGPGPLVGPVLAAQFGYLPGALWILLGVVLGGAVQDFVILFCSLRRDGKSLGQMVREELNGAAGWIAQLAILAILIILLAVLALVVVNALAESPWGVFTVGATIPIALLMGFYLRRWRPGKVLEASAMGVVLLLLAVGGGQFVYGHPALAARCTFRGEPLAWSILAYGFAASVLPIWLLLAPRDYLSTFVKLGTIGLLAAGIFVVLPRLHMPALTAFGADGHGPVFSGKLFPFCFITIACGADFGFSRADLQRHDAEDSWPARATRGRRLRRDVPGIAGGHHGADCGLHAGAGHVHEHEYEGRCRRDGGESHRAGLSRQRQSNESDGGQDWGKDLVRAGGRGGDAGRGNGAMFFPPPFAGREWTCGITSPSCSRRCLFSRHWMPGRGWGAICCRICWGNGGGHWEKPNGRVPRGWRVFSWSAAWGYFLIQGVRDPLGGINSLWPIFGIANQLLASIALCLGTTIILKMQLAAGGKNGRPVLAWITLGPLLWLLAVTATAGVEKVFHPDPKIGFLSAARVLALKLPELKGAVEAASAQSPAVAAAASKAWGTTAALYFNARLDAVVTGGPLGNDRFHCHSQRAGVDFAAGAAEAFPFERNRAGLAAGVCRCRNKDFRNLEPVDAGANAG